MTVDREDPVPDPHPPESQVGPSADVLRLFHELPFVGMAVTSPTTTRWLHVNRTLCDLLGYPREELVEKTWVELTHPDDTELDLSEFRRVLAGETEGYKLDKRFLHRTGAVVHASIDVKAIRRADRQIDFFVATITDRTAQVVAEAAARASRERLEKLAQQVPGVLFQFRVPVDGDPCFEFVTDQVTELVGVTPEAVYADGGLLARMVHPDDLPRLTESMAAAGAALRPWAMDFRVVRVDGAERWLGVRAGPERLPDGGVSWRGFVADTTEQEQARRTLRDQAARLAAVVDGTLDGVAIAETTTRRFTYGNEAMFRLLGVTPEEFLNLTVDDIHPVAALESLLPHFRVFGDAYRGRLSDVPVQRKDGQVLTVELTGSRVVLDGRTHNVGLFHDTTEQRRTERALLQFKETLDRTTDCVFMFDRGSLQFTYVNQGACRHVGWSEGELLQMHPYDIKPRIQEPAFREMVAPLLAGTVSEVRFETVHRHRDGHDIPVEISLQYVAPPGDEGRFVAVVRDMTEQVRAREALERLQAAVDAAQSAVAMADPEGRLTYVNRALLRSWGHVDAGELLGTTVWSLLRPDAESEGILAALRQHGRWSGERVARRPDGTSRTVQMLANTFGQGWIHASFVDVTEERSLQAQLVQSQKLESVGRLAGGIAHDFNNLLTVVKGYLESALEAVPAGGVLHDDLCEIDRAADSAAALTQQLLAFSRRQIIAPVVLDLNGVVRQVQGMLERLLGEDILLNVQTDPGLWRVRFDRAQVEQILVNLAVNARDAMPAGGRLTIETSNQRLGEDYVQQHPGVVPGDYVMLAVSDSGVGMTEETRANAFEPFYTTKRLGRGTGLGLAVIHGAVSQNGGRIELYSEPGHGTSFKIYLPRTAEPERPVPTRNARELPRGTETLLVTEDDPAVRSLAVRLLERLGYRVLAFESPSSALAWLAENAEPIHLLLTDVVMPHMNGKELADRVLALRPGTKVLFVSGYTANVIVHHGVLKPGVEFLAKPYTVQTLAGRVRELLDG